jgi:carbamoyltransferase
LPYAKKLIPGIVHVDGTCRIQTVSDGFIFDLLSRYYNQTGCPVILNTSFNLAGEPLVQTKEEAIDTLIRSSLDAVYFVDDKRLITKDDL